jgi:nucleoside-diphosphate-sugar epimerase
MYCLEVIKSINQTERVKIRDNFNRECSWCITPKGAVIHSKSQRSTAYIKANTDGFKHLLKWIKTRNKSAIFGFIEATVYGTSLENANLTALIRARKHFSFTVKRARWKGVFEYEATAPSGKLQTQLASLNPFTLFSQTKTRKLPCQKLNY